MAEKDGGGCIKERWGARWRLTRENQNQSRFTCGRLIDRPCLCWFTVAAQRPRSSFLHWTDQREQKKAGVFCVCIDMCMCPSIPKIPKIRREHQQSTVVRVRNRAHNKTVRSASNLSRSAGGHGCDKLRSVCKNLVYN